MTLSVALRQLPLRGGAKGGDGSRRADLYFFRNEPCRNRRNRLPNLRHSEERSDVGIRSPWGNVWSWYGVWGCGFPRPVCALVRDGGSAA